ncbi:VOC family protein [Streptomyces sp. AJS327]|uniref:VOC family protein n=1 Tax=Streptomyces sp. AJS327 TaxID=2545265 RepID=UPI0015DDDEEF|nr:VOC family protein [Streptomyces sp. AJS327]MBA0049727.1 VOC family protein [Streptomyces sp. AJS327]
MPVLKGLQTGHVGLNVTGLERSTAFYTRVLGLDVLAEGAEEGRRYAFLGVGGAPLLTLWEQSEGTHPARLPGLHHLAFQVESVAVVWEAERLLRDLGASFAYDGVVPHAEGSASGGVFFSDPDGIRLEIYAPTGTEGATAPDASAPTCGFF